MTDDIEFETLSAYVDGELPEAERRRVEQVLAVDPAKRSEVRRLRENTSLVRAAFNEALTAEAPQHVVDAINAAVTHSIRDTMITEPRRAKHAFAFWPTALAASLAAVVVGLATSYLVTDYRIEQRMAQLASGREADQILRDSTLSAALEQQISGQAVKWTNPDTGASGRITPVRTFKSKTGQWCREFDSVLTREEQSEMRRGIACREPEGTWKIRVVLYEES